MATIQELADFQNRIGVDRLNWIYSQPRGRGGYWTWASQAGLSTDDFYTANEWFSKKNDVADWNNATQDQKNKLIEAQKLSDQVTLQDVVNNPNLNAQQLANNSIIKYWSNESEAFSRVINAINNDPSKIKFVQGEEGLGITTGEHPGYDTLYLKPTSKENIYQFSTYNQVAGGNISGVLFADPKTGKVAPIIDATKQISYTPGTSGSFVGGLVGTIGNMINDLGPIGQIGLAYLTGGLGSAIAEELIANELVSSVIADTVGNAIAKTVIDVAQGKDLGESLTNSIVNAVVQTGTPDIANTISTVVENKDIANVLTSAVSSAGSTLLKGGDLNNAIKNAVAGATGSVVATETGEKALGAATIGGLTGGLQGAALGAAGALGRDIAKSDTAGTQTAVDTGTQATDVAQIDTTSFEVATPTQQQQILDVIQQAQVPAGYSDLQNEISVSNLTPEEVAAVNQAAQQVYAGASTTQALPATTFDAGGQATGRIGSPFASNDPNFYKALVKNPNLLSKFSEYTNTYGYSGVGDASFLNELVNAYSEAPKAGDYAKDLKLAIENIIEKNPSLGTSAIKEIISPTLSALPSQEVVSSPVTTVDITQPEQVVEEVAPAVAPAAVTPSEITTADTYIVAAVNPSGTQALVSNSSGDQIIVDVPAGSTVTPNQPVTVNTATSEIVSTQPSAAQTVVETPTSVTPTDVTETVTPSTPVTPAQVGGLEPISAPTEPVSAPVEGVVTPVETSATTPAVISEVFPETVTASSPSGIPPSDVPPAGGVTPIEPSKVEPIVQTPTIDQQIMDLTGITPTQEPITDTVKPPVTTETPTTTVSTGISETPTKTTDQAEPTEEQIAPEPYKPEFFVAGGVAPTLQTRRPTLAPTLQTPFYSPLTTTGLTSYRGAGEIESSETGGKRRNVWNEASLRLKDALGI